VRARRGNKTLRERTNSCIFLATTAVTVSRIST
jgi:hypothetical protein